MNTSLQDGYNIGWKLAAAIKGQADPNILETYDLERQKTAADLIHFDRSFAKMFSSASHISPQDFAQQFKKSGQFTAGLSAIYGDSCITSARRSTPSAAKNLVVGMRFPTVQVVRFCDARAMQLCTALPSDGRWRIIVFAGDVREHAAANRLKEVRGSLPFSHSFTVLMSALLLECPSKFLPRLIKTGPTNYIHHLACFLPFVLNGSCRQLHSSWCRYRQHYRAITSALWRARRH